MFSLTSLPFFLSYFLHLSFFLAFSHPSHLFLFSSRILIFTSFLVFPSELPPSFLFLSVSTSFLISSPPPFLFQFFPSYHLPYFLTFTSLPISFLSTSLPASSLFLFFPLSTSFLISSLSSLPFPSF